MSTEARTWARKQRTDGIASKAALLVLADYAGKDGSCWPAVSTLAEDACTDHRTMRRLLNRLSDAGLLMIEQRVGRPSIYRLPLETQGSHPRVETAEPGGRTPDSAPEPRGVTPDPAASTQGSHPGGVGVTPLGGRGHTPPNRHEPSLTKSNYSGRRGREHATPAALDATATSPAGFVIVSAWAAANPGVTTVHRRALGKAVDGLLATGARPDLVPAALDAAHSGRWRNPIGALPLAYEDARRAAAEAARPGTEVAVVGDGPPARIPTTTARVAAALALKRPEWD